MGAVVAESVNDDLTVLMNCIDELRHMTDEGDPRFGLIIESKIAIRRCADHMMSVLLHARQVGLRPTELLNTVLQQEALLAKSK